MRRKKSKGYWDKVRATFRRFHRTMADFASTGRVVSCLGERCQLCGHRPIKSQHEISSLDGKVRLWVGRDCVTYYPPVGLFVRIGEKKPLSLELEP